MNFGPDEKLLALATAFRALAVTLWERGALDLALFEHHTTHGVARLAAIGEADASAAMAELMEPMLSDLRSLSASRGAASRWWEGPTTG